jgi:hypothetical protein
MPVFGFIVLPAVGALVCVFLLTQLSAIALFLGIGWLVLGVIYLAFITKGFRQAPPETNMVANADEKAAAVSVDA